MSARRIASRQRVRWLGVAAGVMAVAATGLWAAQAAESAALAERLAMLMTDANLEAVAGRNADEPDRFVAALVFPGQLLAVSARYEVPMYMENKLSSGAFRDVYIDLNAASIPNTKVLVTDVGADGLSEEGGDVYDDGARRIRFDGEWDDQGLSEEEYMAAFAEAEAVYTNMLQALIEQAQG